MNLQNKCLICGKVSEEDSKVYGMSCHKDCLIGKTDEEVLDFIRKKI